MLVHVEQAGHNFVERVVRRPDGLAFVHAIEERLGISGEETLVVALGRQRGLTLRQLGDDVIGFGPQFLVAGAGVHQRAGREVMADEMAAQFAFRRFPTAERFSGRRQSGGDAEIVEEPVGVEVVEVFVVALLCVLERAVEQPDLLQVERPGLEGDFHFGGAQRGQRRQQQGSDQRQEGGALGSVHRRRFAFARRSTMVSLLTQPVHCSEDHMSRQKWLGSWPRHCLHRTASRRKMHSPPTRKERHP